MFTEHFTIDRLSRALLRGRTLHAEDVTAGNGKVIDWRTTKSGNELQIGADAFDTARLFLTLVGEDAALESVRDRSNVREVA